MSTPPYLRADPHGRLPKLSDAGIYPYQSLYNYDATLFHIKDDYAGVGSEPEELNVSLLVRVVGRMDNHVILQFECEALTFDARAILIFDLYHMSETDYSLALQHLYLGDLIGVETAYIFRGPNGQLCLTVKTWEMVSPNLVDFTDLAAFDTRHMALADLRRSIDRRSKLLGLPPHFFSGQIEARNVTDGSMYVPIYKPNLTLWEAVATTGRPAVMLAAIPSTDGFGPSLAYDAILFASDLLHPLDGQMKPYVWILRSLGNHAKDLCGSRRIPAILPEENEGGLSEIDPCTIDISQVSRVVAFYDLLLLMTALDFLSFSSVDEAVKESRLLLPDDGQTYKDVESVALAVARHSVFRTLIRPTVVHSFPSTFNPYARYQDSEGITSAHSEIYINGRQVAAYAEEENHVLAIHPNHARLIHTLNYGVAPTVRVQLFIDTFLGLFTRSTD